MADAAEVEAIGPGGLPAVSGEKHCEVILFALVKHFADARGCRVLDSTSMLKLLHAVVTLHL